MKKKERGKPTKTSTERRKKSGEGREKKWSKVAAVGPSMCVYLRKCH